MSVPENIHQDFDVNFNPNDEDDPGLRQEAFPIDPALYGGVTIYDALHSIMQEVGIVSKDGKNDFHNYTFTSEAAAIAALRPAFIRHGILALPSFEFELLSDANGNTFITGRVTFFHVPSRTSFEGSFLGAGNDRNSKGGVGDKAVYKAMTGLLKNAFFHTFMLERRDGYDPEVPTDFERQSANEGWDAKAQQRQGPGLAGAFLGHAIQHGPRATESWDNTGAPTRSAENLRHAVYPNPAVGGDIDSAIADTHMKIANASSLQVLGEAWDSSNAAMAQIWSANPEAYRVLEQKFQQKYSQLQQQPSA